MEPILNFGPSIPDPEGKVLALSLCISSVVPPHSLRLYAWSVHLMIFSFYSFSVDPTSLVLRAPECEVSTRSLQTYVEPANRVGFGDESGKPGEREEG